MNNIKLEKDCICGYNKVTESCRGFCDVYDNYRDSVNVHTDFCEYYNCKRCDPLCCVPGCSRVLCGTDNNGNKYCVDHLTICHDAFNASN